VELRRHHAAFCSAHFLDYFQNQAVRAIHHLRMFTHEDRILVAVSGGKDSLSLWDILHRLAYQTTGLHIHLGIGDYSDASREKTAAFARERGLPLIEVDLRRDYGLGVPELARCLRRVPCSGCGLSKRYIMNRVALEKGFTVLATGHNLDDEAATLLGNVLHWQTEYLARQSPVLESTHPKLVKRVKPFYMLTERETASYALLRGIDYIPDECPHAQGALSLLYKDALDRIELESPGAKQQFVAGFLEKMRPSLREAEEVALQECAACGQPTTTEVCAFCRMWHQALRRRDRAAAASEGASP
jgi:uncharacterized protein (TIGR00269 family)